MSNEDKIKLLESKVAHLERINKQMWECALYWQAEHDKLEAKYEPKKPIDYTQASELIDESKL